MKVYRFDRLKNNFDAGLELIHSTDTITSVFDPPLETDADAIEIAFAILSSFADVDMVRVTEVNEDRSERIVDECYA